MFSILFTLYQELLCTANINVGHNEDTFADKNAIDWWKGDDDVQRCIVEFYIDYVLFCQVTESNNLKQLFEDKKRTMLLLNLLIDKLELSQNADNLSNDEQVSKH